MDIVLEPAGIEEKPVLQHLMQLYQHDMSEFNGREIDPTGVFPYRYLDAYWTEPDRWAFSLRVDGNPAGFALVRRGAMLDDDPETMEIAEFFVLRRHRRSGIGRSVAGQLFNRFPAKWEVRHDAGNTPAEHFWRDVIAGYTGGAFERITDHPRWDGTVYRFGRESDAAKRAGPGLLNET